MLLNILKKIKNYSAFLFAFFLPFKFSISNFFLILFLGITLVEIIIKKDTSLNFKQLKFSTLLLIAPVFIGLIYTAFIKNGFHTLEKSISFLLIPIFISFNNKQALKNIYSVTKKGLIIGVLTAITFLILYNFNKFFFINHEKKIIDLLNFNYTRANFTKPFNIHPTYLGVYVIFTSILVTNYFYKTKKYFLLLVLTLLFIGIIFINQRIIFFIYLIFILSLIFSFLRNLLISKLYPTFYISSLVLITLVVLSYMQIKKSYIYYRFTNELQWEFSENINSFYTTKEEAISDPRLARWKGIINLIKEKPVFGYGTGSEKNILAEMFLIKNMKNSYKFKYDSHNQYLSILIETGVIGLLFFLFFLMSNFYFAIKFRNFEYFGLFLIISIVSLVENILTRNAGITFFAFFSALYLFNKNTEKK